MKHLIIFIMVPTFIVTPPKSNAGWFHDDSDKEQIVKLENQIQDQQHANGGIEAIALLLGVGCFVALIGGTIIGTKARRDAKDHEN